MAYHIKKPSAMAGAGWVYHSEEFGIFTGNFSKRKIYPTLFQAERDMAYKVESTIVPLDNSYTPACFRNATIINEL